MTRAQALAIMANLTASRDEVESLMDYSIQWMVRHPNCPDDLWWDWALRYPLAAVDSALFPLILLESPDRWQTLVEAECNDWIRTMPESKLSDRRWILLCADTIEHALSVFPKTLQPGELSVVEQLVATMRAYGHDEVSWQVLQNAHDPVFVCRNIADREEGKGLTARQRILHMASTRLYWETLRRAIEYRPKAPGADPRWKPIGPWVWERFLWYWRQSQDYQEIHRELTLP